MKRLLVFIIALTSMLPVWSVSVGVLLPFKDKTQLGQSMIEFYRGFLMAVDSAKHEGISVQVYAIDAGTTQSSLQQVLSQGRLPQVDFVLGPGSAEQAALLSSYCLQHSMRLIMPFNTPCAQIGSNPNVTQTFITSETLYTQAVQLMIENLADAHFVLWKSGAANDEGNVFQTYAQQRLMNDGLACSTLNAHADELAMEMNLNQFRNNVIIPDTPSEKNLEAMIQSFRNFQQKHPQYHISLFGYPEWLSFASKHTADLHALNTYIFTSYYTNELSGRTIRFRQGYKRCFHKTLGTTIPCLAMSGFDLGYLLLHGSNPMPLQQGFSFQSVGDSGGWVNRQVQLVNWGTNQLIRQIQ